jgi:hypothetical protein
MDSRQQTKLARSIGLIVEILAGVKSLTPQVADSIRTIASDISRAVFKATTLRSATSRLKAVLADFYHSPISSDPAMETCLFDWLGYGEIEFALESDQRMERPLNELLHQFVRLHPATKLAALIETGRVLVGADRPRI